MFFKYYANISNKAIKKNRINLVNSNKIEYPNINKF